MIKRTIYAIKEIWYNKAQLKRYITDPNLQLQNVQQISAKSLAAENINALVLDFDGVLAAHGEPNPRPEIVQWLQGLCSVYAPHKIFILSNKPNEERRAYFQQYFPEIRFIKATRKKPYPDGMLEIIKIAGVPSDQVMLVDDRLGTGILVTLIVGVKGRWITKPYVNLKSRFFTEIGFEFIRRLERIIIALIG